MQRVADALAVLGAKIDVRPDAVLIQPTEIHSADVHLGVPSAQLKSAVLLAAAAASVDVKVSTPGHARDHTERMLRMMGATIAEHRDADDSQHLALTIQDALQPIILDVPGDASAAAFMASAAALIPGSNVTLEHLSVNPTRTGFFRALSRMGTEVSITNPPPEFDNKCSEPSSSVTVSAAPLRAIEVGAAEVPTLIDELPLLALLATQAGGRTRVSGAAELRFKECDRLAVTAQVLNAMGARIDVTGDGWTIDGPTPLHGATVQTSRDHRIAMMLRVAQSVASGRVEIDDTSVIADSFPTFTETLSELSQADVPSPAKGQNHAI